MNSPIICAYIRLSRSDLDAPGGMEQKFQDRANATRALAARHGYVIPDSEIHVEQESASSLSKRPVLRALLDRLSKTRGSVAVCLYHDRLTRGSKTDEDQIERALLQGRVTLVTADAGIIQFDESYSTSHALLFAVKSAVSRYQIADLASKRRETKLTKLARNHRTSGYAPYGYRSLKAPLDSHGQAVAPTLADVEAGKAYRTVADEQVDKTDNFAMARLAWHRYEIIPSEFGILREIFRRVLVGEQVSSVLLWLNSSHVPPPSHEGRGDAPVGVRWHRLILDQMLRNPFYAGHLAQRKVKEPDGRFRPLHPEEYIVSAEVGEWPLPVAAEDWQRLQQRFTRHTDRPVPRTGLLTGLLYCAQGQPMRRGSEVYLCRCWPFPDAHHKGMHISCARIEPFARDVLFACLDALPASLTVPRKRTAQPTANELPQARRALQEALTRAQEMIAREPYFVDLMGKEVYEATARNARTQIETARARVEALEAAAKAPDFGQVIRLRAQVREVGAAEWWSRISRHEQRAALALFVERITLDKVPDGRRFVRGATVELAGWVKEMRPTLPRLRLAQSRQRR